MNEDTEVTLTIRNLARFMCAAGVAQRIDNQDDEAYRNAVEQHWKSFVPAAINAVENMLMAEKLESKTGVH
jgi:hypothetical protein